MYTVMYVQHHSLHIGMSSWHATMQFMLINHCTREDKVWLVFLRSGEYWENFRKKERQKKGLFSLKENILKRYNNLIGKKKLAEYCYHSLYIDQYVLVFSMLQDINEGKNCKTHILIFFHVLIIVCIESRNLWV